MNKYFYTYVLQFKNKKLYIGYCKSLKNRLKEHFDGRVDSTKFFRPLELIYFEACLSKKLAEKRERQLKSGYGRGYLKRRLNLH